MPMLSETPASAGVLVLLVLGASLLPALVVRTTGRIADRRPRRDLRIARAGTVAFVAWQLDLGFAGFALGIAVALLWPFVSAGFATLPLLPSRGLRLQVVASSALPIIAWLLIEVLVTGAALRGDSIACVGIACGRVSPAGVAFVLALMGAAAVCETVRRRPAFTDEFSTRTARRWLPTIRAVVRGVAPLLVGPKVHAIASSWVPIPLVGGLLGAAAVRVGRSQPGEPHVVIVGAGRRVLRVWVYHTGAGVEIARLEARLLPRAAARSSVEAKLEWAGRICLSDIHREGGMHACDT